MLCVDTLGNELMSGQRLELSLCGAASGPVKTGPIYMLPAGARGRGLRVMLSVYDTSFDRYAVIAPDKVYCKACGYINLKNVQLKKMDDTSFQLLPRDCDGSSLTFCVTSPTELTPWIRALGSSQSTEFPTPVRQRSCSHPQEGARTSLLPSASMRTPMTSSGGRCNRRRTSRLSLPSLREEDSLSEANESEEE